MGDIGQSLTRKLGPLPVWVWALIVGLGLYLLRNRGQSGGSNNTAAATDAEAKLITAQAAARASTLQTPVMIAPGEQVYDPSSGFISPVNTDWPNILGVLGNQPTSTTTPTPTPAPTPKKKQPKLRGKGAIRAPSGHKPTAPKGYRDKGLGGGFWEFLPVTRAHKGAGKGTKNPPKTTKPGHRRMGQKKSVK